MTFLVCSKKCLWLSQFLWKFLAHNLKLVYSHNTKLLSWEIANKQIFKSGLSLLFFIPSEFPVHFPPVSSHSVVVFSWKPVLSVHQNLNQVNVKFKSIENYKSDKKPRNYWETSIFYNTYQYTTVNILNLR